MEYMDKTFCAFYTECWHCVDDPEGCSRALTPQIILAADKCGLPICQFTSKPGCFKEITK